MGIIECLSSCVCTFLVDESFAVALEHGHGVKVELVPSHVACVYGGQETTEELGIEPPQPVAAAAVATGHSHGGRRCRSD